LGVKVWIYKGEVIGSRAERAEKALAEARAPKPERRGPRTPRAPRAEVTTSHVEVAPVAVDTTPAAPVTEGGAQ
jgi:small subunit ribosomal protein S3